MCYSVIVHFEPQKIKKVPCIKYKICQDFLFLFIDIFRDNMTQFIPFQTFLHSRGKKLGNPENVFLYI